MCLRRFSLLAVTMVFTLISADTESASGLYSIDIGLSTPTAVADEVGKTTAEPAASLDIEQNCGSAKLSQGDKSAHDEICRELKQMRETLKHLQNSVHSFRDFIVANKSRCDRMELLATESTNRVRELSQKLIDVDKEREQLKYLLQDLNLKAEDQS